ncbi:diguanylate phosphodiesterase [Novimethylophilus kurashikiensis]|uniref:Diguanylate phosphodiesterase n=1 Tax=Novimethylophilus kurashikiensis TaxID=1825523 RepID=A0A2R5FCT5_9PROT|nr:HDOD domain-containing protein [Novimethylophilus kurashikiensis]GBG14454.1 diguanylate phosphodiesterase [Novimethylophilus kurashikiensis]
MSSMAVPQVAAEQLLVNMRIPPCPRVVTALINESHEEFPDFDKLDKLISGDVGLASAVLKTANSPYYGLSRKASAVKQAMTILGSRTVIQIVTMLALRNAFPANNMLERFWDRSTYHAIACARIARYLSLMQADIAFTFGLFNDCGIPIMFTWFENYKDVLAQANKAVKPFIALENDMFGTNHAIVGAALAQEWHLPENICVAIREHHSVDPLYGLKSDVDPQGKLLRCISIVADYMVNRFLDVEQETEWKLHGPAALHQLGTSEADLDFIYSYVCDELREAQSYRG